MSTEDKIALFALLVSVAAFIFSFISYRENLHLAKQGFTRGYRPYVSAMSFGYIDHDDGILHLDMNRVMLLISNAPATILAKSAAL